MTGTIEQFRQAVISTGLLCESELDSLLDEIPVEQRPQTPQSLGEFLVNKRKLTAYQAKKVLQQKSDELLLGKYIIQDVIRRGAMGVVYRARHAQMKRDVALKVILSKLADDTECVARFHREVHLAARLNHPNIVTAYDASEENGQLFLVMEFIEGEDLKTIINKKGGVSIRDAVDYIAQAARGLKYAHEQGVIHRDVKPSNLLLDKSGKIKILDVGLAMEENDRHDSDLTLSGGLLGSVNYMSPEQARDARNADARSDIYSLGCTLWYLLAGSFIYEEKTVVNRILAHRERPVPDLESLGDDIPAELQIIFQQMVAKHPDDRYQSMDALLEDLEKLQANLSGVVTVSFEEACDTTYGGDHDTDHIRDSSDKQLIDVPHFLPDDTAPDDPTCVNREPALSSQLQVAMIVIGGFGIGCLAMLGIHLLEREGLLASEQQNRAALESSAENLPSPTDAGSAPLLAADPSTDSESELTEISTDDTPETTGLEVGRPLPAEAPFSPEQARIHQQQWADYLGTEVEQTNSLGMKLILIPPGTYRMGSTPDDLAKLVQMFPDELLEISRQFNHELPPHSVTLTRPYYISAHVVTFAQFQRFVRESGYPVQDATLEGWEELRSSKATVELNDLPIRHICWNDAVAFCQWLSETEQRMYRLPTEAEWEYACRAGSQDLFGHDSESLYEHEWWNENAGWARPVGSRQANAFGLFDMQGNIREYCQDFYSRFTVQSQTDPLIDTPHRKDHRVVRGGGAASKRYEIRPGRRSLVSASDLAVSYIGFRIVTPVISPEKTNLQAGRMLSFLTEAE